MRSLILALPLLELALLIALGAAIGAGPTFLIIGGTGLAGFILLSVTRRARFPTEPRPQGAGRPFPGGAITLSGFLLMIPGILTDLLGLVLLIPAPRRWIMERGKRYMFKRFTGMDMQDGPFKEAFEAVQRAEEQAQNVDRPAGAPLIIDAEVTAIRDDPS